MLNNTIQECVCVGKCLGHKWTKGPFDNQIDNVVRIQSVLKKNGLSYEQPMNNPDGSVSISFLTGE